MPIRSLSLPAPCALRVCLAALAVGGLTTACAPRVSEISDWPEFRDANHAGIADGAELPAHFDAIIGKNIAWATAIPGLGHSSPIVIGGTVYLTTSVPLETIETELITGDVAVAGVDTAGDLVPHSWRLYAVDRNSGKILWHRVATEGVPRLKRHVKSSHASATPASDGERIVALFGYEGLFCFDLDGNLLWRRDVGLLDVGYWGSPEYQWGPASSPGINDGLVIVQNDRQVDSELVAYDLDDGTEVWRVQREEKPAWSTPTIVSGERSELVLNGARWLTAYDPRSGEELWRLSNNDAQVIVPTPLAVGGRIIITGGYPAGARPSYAVLPGGSGDITPAAGAGSSEHVLWSRKRGSPYTPTPIAYRGILYVIVDNGILAAYDLPSGERLYRTRLSVGAGYSASPVASDGLLYFPSEDGDVMVVRAGPEYELVAVNPIGEVLLASPAISGRMLIIRGQNHLFGISQSH